MMVFSGVYLWPRRHAAFRFDTGGFTAVPFPRRHKHRQGGGHASLADVVVERRPAAPRVTVDVSQHDL